jgi:hypothetical protein
MDESDPKADEESEAKHIRSVPDNLLILKAHFESLPSQKDLSYILCIFERSID